MFQNGFTLTPFGHGTFDSSPRSNTALYAIVGGGAAVLAAAGAAAFWGGGKKKSKKTRSVPKGGGAIPSRPVPHRIFRLLVGLVAVSM